MAIEMAPSPKPSNISVAVICLQHSACTVFALYLCELLAVPHHRCISDSEPCASGKNSSQLWLQRQAWHSAISMAGLYPRNVIREQQEIAVVKLTLSGYSAAALRALDEIGPLFTHRILWVREPMQNYFSLAKESWAKLCGGILNKLGTLDSLFAARNGTSGNRLFDFVMRAEDFSRANSSRIVRQLQLVPGAVLTDEDIMGAFELKRVRHSHLHSHCVRHCMRGGLKLTKKSWTISDPPQTVCLS